MLGTIVGSIVGWELLKWVRRRRKKARQIAANKAPLLTK